MDDVKRRQALEDAIERLEEANDLLMGIDDLDEIRRMIRKCSGEIETALYEMDTPKGNIFDFDMVSYANNLMAGCR